MIITPLIMCGGAGTRLWPASREGRPKQFLRLFGPHSTFQDTMRRVCDPAVFGRPVVITNAQYRFLVAEQLQEIGVTADILLEPMRRDSGPAIAAGAAFAARVGDGIVLALAADHVVTDVAALKRLVQKLKDVAPAVTEDHLKVHRPWGSYQSLDSGARYQVKRIVVKKGGRLSLQYHNHRAEHWVIVRGTAKVTIGNDVKTLHENESVYIPIGTPHRLENPGKIELELIEVQTGSYLGEDDIVRIEDDYRRS